MIAEEIKKVFRVCSSNRVQHQSLVGLDFKIADERNILFRLCFSVLANWPLAIVLLILYLNPYRYQLLLQSLFPTDNQLLLWSYSENFVMAFLICTIIGSLLGFEILWLSIIAWLVSNGEIHVLISVGAASGIIFSSARRNLKLISLLQAKMKNTWMYFSLLQMVSACLSSLMNYFLYVNLKNFGFFSATMSINRYEFFVLSVCIHYATQFVVLSIWGHFYSRRKVEPADWKISYSTADMIKKLNLSREFKFQLKLFCQEKLQIKSEIPEVTGIPDRLLKLSASETEFLKIAVQNLN